MTLEEQILSLQSENRQLKAINSELLTRIAGLEALVMHLSKDSKNSSKPPSTDIGRKNQSLRSKSDKAPGAPKGHKGHTLKMSETPDLVEELVPDFCNCCGKSLDGSTFDLVARRQVIDIPPIVPVTTEYQCYATQCTCGHYQSAKFPQGVNSHVQYGPNIQSLALYQSYYQFIPFARLQDFFKKVCGVNLSKGTLENFIRSASKKAETLYTALHRAIIVSFFVGSDETSHKTKGRKGWFWVWQTAVVTYIVAATSRSKQLILDTFPNGLPNSIVCSDRLAAQLSTASKARQVCLAHLLRELNYLAQAEKHIWATEFKTLLSDAIKLKQAQAAYTKDDENAKWIEQRAQRLLNA